MYELKIITRFAAAHQLQMVAKQCENLHGHNWKIEVCVTGKELNQAGVLIDFGELKGHLAKIIDQLDHKFLNELEILENRPPSSENVARFIAYALDAALDNPAIQVSSVTAWESDDACATYMLETGD
jgi:6-pyruvoyltetrahydropterin/6-carboxytetrahydropterin synthase